MSGTLNDITTDQPATLTLIPSTVNLTGVFDISGGNLNSGTMDVDQYDLFIDAGGVLNGTVTTDPDYTLAAGGISGNVYNGSATNSGPAPTCMGNFLICFPATSDTGTLDTLTITFTTLDANGFTASAAATSFNAQSGATNTFDFSLTGSVQASPVPLPGAVWLFGSALLGLATVARRRTVQ